MIVFRCVENTAFDQNTTLQICNEILKQKTTQVFLTVVGKSYSPIRRCVSPQEGNL